MVNFHVLYHRLEQTLALTEDVTPTAIKQSTMDMSLVYLDMLLRNGVASRSIGSAPVLTYTSQELVQVMLNIPRPFITAQGTYNRCASTCRPTPQQVKGVVEEVLGSLWAVVNIGNNSPVFFKELPTSINDEDVWGYGMNAITYRDIFDSRDKLLTTSQVASFLPKHPAREAYQKVYLTTIWK